MEPTTEAPQKRSKQPKQQVDPLYRVDSKDYSETFDTKGSAIKQADYLKKRAVKEQTAVKITVTEILDGKDGKVVHSVKIGESFFK